MSPSTSEPFDIQVRKHDDHIEIRMAGVLSETVRLSADDIPPGRSVFIDLEDIKRISSYGVRTWIRYLDVICAKAPRVVIRKIPPSIVNEASIVRNFLCDAFVESFFVPYYCDECDFEEEELRKAGIPIPPTKECHSCGDTMETEFPLELYAGFQSSLERA